MMNGNISNREAPVIAFNIDNLLFEKKENSIFDIIFNNRKVVNQNFIDIVNNVWYNYDFSIYLISSQTIEESEKKLEGIDIQATKVVSYTGIDNLRRMLNYRFHLYVDSDESLISQLGNNAIHIDNLQDHLRINRR